MTRFVLAQRRGDSPGAYVVQDWAARQGASWTVLLGAMHDVNFPVYEQLLTKTCAGESTSTLLSTREDPMVHRFFSNVRNQPILHPLDADAHIGGTGFGALAAKLNLKYSDFVRYQAGQGRGESPTVLMVLDWALRPEATWEFLLHAMKEVNFPVYQELLTANDTETSPPVISHTQESTQPSLRDYLETIKEKDRNVEGNEELKTCVICEERIMAVVFGCGHASSCVKCSISICSGDGTYLKCPECRADVTTAMFLFSR
jgi:hypothetical protein